MLSLRIAHKASKGALGMMVGIFCFLVGYNNIIDFNTNFQFVQHVLSMDAMEPWFNGENLNGRAITNDSFMYIGYWGIILGELTAGVLCIVGAFFMLRNICNEKFELGQALFITGGTIAALVWYFGFAVIGAEWFQMWASQWNGQMKAYTFAMFILVTMIYVIVPTPKLSV